MSAVVFPKLLVTVKYTREFVRCQSAGKPDVRASGATLTMKY
jgi:hypothetical protein